MIFSKKNIAAWRLYATLFTRLENAEILNIGAGALMRGYRVLRIYCSLIT